MAAKGWAFGVALVAALGGAAWYGQSLLYANKPPQGAAQAQSRPRAEQTAKVEVVKVVRGPVADIVESVGTSKANEAVTIAPKVAGVIAKLNFKEGDLVPAGAVLVELDAHEAAAQFEATRSQRDNAKQAYDRARSLLSASAATQARVDELALGLRTAEALARAAEARLADLRIVAPFAGRIGLRRVSVGAFVSPGTAIATLDDLSIVKVEFGVPELSLGRLRPGLPVEARADAFRDRIFRGMIAVIDSRVDPVSRAIPVRADVPNPDGTLKPGMFLSVQLTLDRRENALLIPEEALVPESDRQYVYVVTDGKAVKTQVEVGQRMKGQVEIRGGISEGQLVVTAGMIRLRNGMAVRYDQPAASS